ncbi:unnamed protein product (macronuclear) [Paramecium tetraurelia]|uniref:HTH psq-type domain-containing protein n=1 Tax=Paramecium tetraurelia TaxID=5888 RepID=A0BY22_PARTE|nr:uncharacterized protein GSPATT00033292001 [Paramecium tetraurelia]CAK63439.1 unnamed protein product [Paramecium tetraurelia]|eukprot:XP_001430837.1 hypothetical protein (macronuclear) [Paramecium tetraurelia strain d4-2]
MDQTYKRSKRTYIKSSLQTRKLLAELVLIQGLKIKNAAKKLQIKYATAKSIILYYRQNVIKKQQNYKPTKQCSYASIKSAITYTIVSKLAGQHVNSRCIHFLNVTESKK